MAHMKTTTILGLPLRRSFLLRRPRPPVPECFGVRSWSQLRRDYGEMIRDGLRGDRFQFDVASAGLLRPELSLPAYAGVYPRDGLAPIFNLFDRTGGGRRFSARVSRRSLRDFRGGRLSYDEHDGTDFVCPVATPLVAAAPGRIAWIRDRWLRGGLTVMVDHGFGVTTQYTHCSRALAEVGQVVSRGMPVALSGVSGVDMTQFFPWVPPHLHFMVWLDGQPRDPFLAPGEQPGSGTWTARNQPLPADLLTSERVPEPSALNRHVAEEAARTCEHAGIVAEIEDADRAGASALGALLEDALHHDMHAWPAGVAQALRSRLRPAPLRRSEVRLTLPLGASEYQGARFADTRRTRPG